jgi:hypothetical protein
LKNPEKTPKRILSFEILGNLEQEDRLFLGHPPAPSIQSEPAMTKRRPKARTHSLCGQPLDAITLCEVIPANYYVFIEKQYRESVLPDDAPELLTELRCSYCNEVLKGPDLDYVQKRLVETNNDSGL